MSRETLEAVIAWQQPLTERGELELIFHGGEPLVPGAAFYHDALPLLRDGLLPRRTRFSVQSNLWLLTDELCELFRQYDVAVGTSLDGPEEVNDKQRGAGYFRRTMAGIEMARAHGLDIGCICTLTNSSAERLGDVFDFFVSEGLDFAVHPALPSLRHPEASAWSLSPEAYGTLLVTLLERYLESLTTIRVHTLDALCRSVSSRSGAYCTFGDCLGNYAAVDPSGDVYPCQRFGALVAYRLGNVNDVPARQTLATSSPMSQLRERRQRVEQECGGCQYFAFCAGGCPYNAIAAQRSSKGGDQRFKSARDPYCSAYRRIFDFITDRALEEVFSAENLSAVMDDPSPTKGLIRRGTILSLLGAGPHPRDVSQNARRIVAAVALAETGSPEKAAGALRELGIAEKPSRTEQALATMYRRLAAPVTGRNNVYVHVTLACPLSCLHCYAEAGPQRDDTMPIEWVTLTIREAAALGFRQAVITGGEPLAHPDQQRLLDALADLRTEVKPLCTTLRTSLAISLDPTLIDALGHCADEIVVSLDGDRATHDARRGIGNYDWVVANLQALVARACGTEVSLAATLPPHLASGVAGESVRALARELGIARVRFSPLLPLGRAECGGLELAFAPHVGSGSRYLDGENRFSPRVSCGLGENLSIQPDGRVYPCHACHGEEWLLGHLEGSQPLSAIVESQAFKELRRHTVDSHWLCSGCPVRYLCGGTCRAWHRDGQATLGEGKRWNAGDALPSDCGDARGRAESMLVAAIEHLGISPARFVAAGLSYPGTRIERAGAAASPRQRV